MLVRAIGIKFYTVSRQDRGRELVGETSDEVSSWLPFAEEHRLRAKKVWARKTGMMAALVEANVFVGRRVSIGPAGTEGLCGALRSKLISKTRMTPLKETMC